MTPEEISQLIDEGVTHLHATTVGYHGRTPAWYANQGTRWYKGLAKIAEAQAAVEATQPPPASSFGADLPARLPLSTGPTVEASTLALMRTMISTATANTTVKQTAPFDLGGQDLVIGCRGNAGATITVDLAAPVRNGRILISRASHTRVLFTDLGFSPIDGVKITDGSNHIDVDGWGGTIHDTKGQGFLQTDPSCFDWQFWNARLLRCGTSTNLDHGFYVAASRGKCVIGSVIVTDPQAYCYQIYPDSRGPDGLGLLVTAFEGHGGRTRGGVIVGSKQAGQQTDATLVGGVITNAVAGAVRTIRETSTAPAPTVRVWDVLASGGASPAFGSGIITDHCEVGWHGTQARGWVQPSRYGLLPALDIDGKPRVTADAGAVAF